MVKKHLYSIKTCHINLLISLLCLFLFSFISACDNGSGNDNNTTGTASFQIQWPGDDIIGVAASQWIVSADVEESAGTGIMAANVTVSEDCSFRGIDKVSVEVMDAYENPLVSKQFACNTGVGKISVPVGSDRMFIISGLGDDGNVRYFGGKNGVTIRAGSNDIGVIQMERSSEFCTDNDGDGFYKEKDCGTAIDCNDNDKNSYPGAIEICGDGIDQDCDGGDEQCQPVPADADGDGVSDAQDQCPNTPAGETVDVNGCSDSQAGSAVINEELAAYYPFNGNANDASENSINGTVHGALLTMDRFDKANSAYHFDGDWDYIEAGTTSDFNYIHDGSDFTISVWVKHDTDNGGGGILGNTIGVDRKGFYLSVSKRNVGFSVGRTSPFPVVSHGWEDVLPTGTNWNHIVVTYDGISKVYNLYVNGQSVNEPVYPSNPHLAGDAYYTLKIGTSKTSPSYGWATADIDDLRFYRSALNAAEVQTLYTGDGSSIGDGDDNDGDGVSDAQDQCPNTPAGGTVDVNGCSDSQKAPVNNWIMENVTTIGDDILEMQAIRSRTEFAYQEITWDGMSDATISFDLRTTTGFSYAEYIKFGILSEGSQDGEGPQGEPYCLLQWGYADGQSSMKAMARVDGYTTAGMNPQTNEWYTYTMDYDYSQKLLKFTFKDPMGAVVWSQNYSNWQFDFVTSNRVMGFFSRGMDSNYGNPTETIQIRNFSYSGIDG